MCWNELLTSDSGAALIHRQKMRVSADALDGFGYFPFFILTTVSSSGCLPRVCRPRRCAFPKVC
jgi:hypothetical protein